MANFIFPRGKGKHEGSRMEEQVQVQVKVNPSQFQVIKGDEVEERQGLTIEFQLNGPITPGEAREVAEKVLCAVRSRVGVGDVIVLSGRGPIWMYGMLISALSGICGISVAVFDPKLGGAVVVHPHYMAGAMVKSSELAETIQ